MEAVLVSCQVTNSIRIGQKTQIGFGKQGAARSNKQATATYYIVISTEGRIPVSVSVSVSAEFNNSPFLRIHQPSGQTKERISAPRRSDGLTPTDALHQVPRSDN